MKTFLITLLLIATVAVLWFLFSPSQRKANYVFEHMKQVKSGMSRQQVTSILSQPDTVYNEETSLVLDYNMGFGAPDGLRVYLQRDSVTDIQYFQ